MTTLAQSPLPAFDRMVEALEEISPGMPPVDAPCHKDICSQERCAYCSRIAKARAALRGAPALRSQIEHLTAERDAVRWAITGEQIMIMHKRWIDAGCPRSMALFEEE